MAYDKTTRILNTLRSRPEIKTPVATDMFIPNHSGITSHPEYKHDTRCWEVNVLSPGTAYGTDTQIPIAYVRKNITITKIVVSLNTAAQEVAGDLKYADNLTAFTNPVVINDFDTTSGVRTDTSITSGSVSEGKFIYIQFDSEPNSAITFMHLHIEWYYD